MELYIIIALCSLCFVLLLALLFRRPQGTSELNAKLAVTDEKINNLDADVERGRMETSNAVNSLARNLESLKTANAEYQAKMIETINASLLEMSKANAEAAERMRVTNEKKLDEMRQTVDEKLTSTLTARLDSSFKVVSEQLENLYKTMGEMKELSGSVTANVSALNRVLTNVKARGTWAEVQLGAILDQTVPGMYETNFCTVQGSNERVEFAVRIPTQEGTVVYLPVDSKFPMEDYVRVCSAADSADADALKAAKKALEDRVLAEAKTVAKYINVPFTTPYAILYLATDALYAEIISSREGLAEKIREQYNVLIAGPTTVTALLNSMAMGFRAVAINEKANEVRRLLVAVKMQYEKFGVQLDKARKKIDEAGRSLDDAQKRNDIIYKKLRSVEEPVSAGEISGGAEESAEQGNE